MRKTVDLIEGPIARAADGQRLSEREALELALEDPSALNELTAAARSLRDRAHGNVISYSRKVFIPLTKLCRDVCHYCTFAEPPRNLEAAFLSIEDVLEIARAGAEAGCHEALFTLGDQPERRYRVAREALAKLGHASTLSYLAHAAQTVYEETGLLPHLNPGVMSQADLVRLREVSVSAGIMVESTSERLCERGGPHYGSPDKQPKARLDTLRAAGEAAVPFTTGILIGIGETRRERLESLLAIRAIDEQYGHIQEVIVQNFRAKPGTLMAAAPEPSLEELRWTIACARLILGPAMNIQAPPNLSPGSLTPLIEAGINDWGGVSPVTPDHVNPEAPWPHLDRLAGDTAAGGKHLVERLAIYPEYCRDARRWLDAKFVGPVLGLVDGSGLVRDTDWTAGAPNAPPPPRRNGAAAMTDRGEVGEILRRAAAGGDLDEADIVRLFSARGNELAWVCETANGLRREVNGDVVSYVVNRNINYTNVCYFKCGFCAFSKGKLSENLRGRPYDLDLDEITRRVTEAWQRGATEVCMQGGIHPEYTGETYLEICRRVKAAAPEMHVHAFSPLEVWQGASTLGLTLEAYLGELAGAGLGTLPGTAAEVLDDRVREVLCPDKVRTAQWLEVMETAHSVGLRSTTTIMFGHVDGPANWARHLLALRALQKRTGGFTEFVPLPFVHMRRRSTSRARPARARPFAKRC